MGTTGMGWR
uniref:Uncharacterized protein n=1 Tax=Arundo donax TaxID=35708 RepID=A0A0A8Y7H8_ARUDO